MVRTLPVLTFPCPQSTGYYPIAITPMITDLLKAGAPIGIGISGGKDSGAMAHALVEYLDQLGHTGPRLLIHADLGLIEWRDSLPMCEQLAQRLGLELAVVHTDMIARWKQRWTNNVDRYAKLLCVKLVMPWSSAQWRFCTGEKKQTPICNELARRFPGQIIVSASGIRREESDQRKKALVSQEQSKLTKKKLQTSGFDWHPIIDWSLADVLAYHQERNIPLHKAYTIGSSRVSCAYCVLSSQGNLYAATLCEENHEAYRELVPLEVVSTFSFQSGSWLGDVAPHLLDQSTREALINAKRRGQRRSEAERRLPKHLLYCKGWPVAVPTWEEACLLSEVRKAVADAVQISIQYTAPGEIRDRYAELITLKQERDETSSRKKKKSA
jgi:3'-phosphoadenosine 5'-phosphosulfate sulfotransferase (PAPS reductase)/FAD synthetase